MALPRTVPVDELGVLHTEREAVDPLGARNATTAAGPSAMADHSLVPIVHHTSSGVGVSATGSAVDHHHHAAAINRRTYSHDLVLRDHLLEASNHTPSTVRNNYDRYNNLDFYRGGQHPYREPWVVLKSPEEGLLVTFDPVSHKIELLRNHDHHQAGLDYCPLCGQVLGGHGPAATERHRSMSEAGSSSAGDAAVRMEDVMEIDETPNLDAADFDSYLLVEGAGGSTVGMDHDHTPAGSENSRSRGASGRPPLFPTSSGGGSTSSRGGGNKMNRRTATGPGGGATGGSSSSTRARFHPPRASSSQDHNMMNTTTSTSSRSNHRTKSPAFNPQKRNPPSQMHSPDIRGLRSHSETFVDHHHHNSHHNTPNAGPSSFRPARAAPYLAHNYFTLLSAVHEEEQELREQMDTAVNQATLDHHGGTGVFPALADTTSDFDGGVVLDDTTSFYPSLPPPPVPADSSRENDEDDEILSPKSIQDRPALEEGSFHRSRSASSRKSPLQEEPGVETLNTASARTGSLPRAESIPTFDTSAPPDTNPGIFQLTTGPATRVIKPLASSGGSQSSSKTGHGPGVAAGHGPPVDYNGLFGPPARTATTTSSAGAATNTASTNAKQYGQLPCGLMNDGYYERFFVEVESLGQGSFGHVFHCRHTIDGEALGEFAVKKVAVGDDRQWLRKIIREVKAFERLNHPNIVQYKHSWLESWQVNAWCPRVPFLFILMQYCNRGSLQQLIDRNYEKVCLEQQQQQGRAKTAASGHLVQLNAPAGCSSHKRGSQAVGSSSCSSAAHANIPTSTASQNSSGSCGKNATEPPAVGLPLPLIWPLLEDILAGIQYLHTQGVLHRDLKCENVLLTSDERSYPSTRALLSDFGTAEWKREEPVRLHRSNSSMDNLTMMKGSPLPDSVNGNAEEQETERYADPSTIDDVDMVPLSQQDARPVESSDLQRERGNAMNTASGGALNNAGTTPQQPPHRVTTTRGSRATDSSNLGTTEYMAPEAFGDLYDEKSDMWSVGVLLFNMRYGKLPFFGQNVLETRALIERFSENYSAKRSENLLPPGDGEAEALLLQGLILALLQPEPWKRPSAGEVLRNRAFRSKGREAVTRPPRGYHTRGSDNVSEMQTKKRFLPLMVASASPRQLDEEMKPKEEPRSSPP
ncbi:unnamed protein product [Amoebophrya sp. A120]|nr:unnamed protein product [Amoebophrya sp. A120]|eukprot:GSA120T00003314001.1